MNILSKGCSPEAAQDRTLPYTAYMVEYKENGEVKFDITICNKQVDLFDYYYDSYGKDFIGWTQTEGRINPKQWQPEAEKKPKGKK